MIEKSFGKKIAEKVLIVKDYKITFTIEQKTPGEKAYKKLKDGCSLTMKELESIQKEGRL